MLLQFSPRHARRTIAEITQRTIISFYFSATSKSPNYPLPISHSETDLLSRYGRIDSHPDTESNYDTLERFVQVQRNGFVPTAHTFTTILSACAKSASLCMGEQTHSTIIKLGLVSNVFIGSALIDMYCKCLRILNAHQLFDEMPHRNVVTYNSLIWGCLQQTEFLNVAFELFFDMFTMGMSLTPFTLSSILVVCSRLELQEVGICVHCISLKIGYFSNIVVGTALIDMYSKCSTLGDSRKAFDEMPERNVITWTSMVTGYAHHRRSNEAIALVREMRRSGFRLNKITYNTLLSSFSDMKDLDHGKQVHCLVIREGLESDLYVVTTLITMYSKCGSSEDLYKIYPTISSKDQILCNSIIAGFSHLGNGKEVLEQFANMSSACINIDSFTFGSVLRAIGILSALEEGKQTHALVLKAGCASNVFVQNGLISMYARCGTIEDSKRVFSSMDGPDLVSWNSLLAGCAQHGHGKEAVELFEQMRSIGIRPDHTTFLSVLSACSHVGLLDKGLEYFKLMRSYDLMEPAKAEHYSCVVDLLGRAGHLTEAEFVIKHMPIKPGISVYRAFLSACRNHGNVDMAIGAAKCLLELCPTDSAAYVLLSNAFAARGCWDDAANVRGLMSEKGVKKRPGCSWIEVDYKDQISSLRVRGDWSCTGVFEVLT